MWEIPPFDESLYYFDPEAAYRVCWFFENQLHHIKGRFYGKKFVLEPWQRNLLAQVYGIKRVEDDLRRYQTVFLALPRKNGKSTLAAGAALYGLYGDGERGAEVYSAAGDRDQAGIIFNIAKSMILMNPKLALRADPQKDIILMRTPPGSFEIETSFYKVVSAEAYSKHGLNPSTIVFDEFHTQPNRELYDVFTTATGSRDQPLIWFITTAGSNKYSICKTVWDDAIAIRDKKIQDDTFLPCIYALEDGDDWHDPQMWKKANPSLGVSLKMEYLMAKHARALRSSAEAKAFKQLHCNMWVDSVTAWLDQDKWAACAENFDEKDLQDFEFIGGADFSAVKDLTALVLLFKKNGLYYVLPYFFMPLDTIVARSLEDKVPYEEWMRAGYIYPIEGSAIDQKILLERFLEILKRFKGKEMVVDAWGVPFILQELDKAGYNVNLFGQTLKNYTAPTKFAEACILNRQIRHNNNPVLNWMASIVEVYQDGNGNIKPMKPKGYTRSDTKRIDGIVALIMALSKHIAAVEGPKKSVYETRGLIRI